MPLPAKLAASDPPFDPLVEGTGGDRPRVGAKAPARGGGRALPGLRTGRAERRDPGRRGGTRASIVSHPRKGRQAMPGTIADREGGCDKADGRVSPPLPAP
jgi:hypothetical protein